MPQRANSILVANLGNQGRLGRFVVEECHLTLAWSGFRKAMQSLSYCLAHPSFPTPILILSATVPPSFVPEMAEAHGIGEENIQVLRKSTARFNLSYQVIECNPRVGQRASDAVLEKSMDQVFKEVNRIVEEVERHPRDIQSASVQKHQIIIYCPTVQLVEDMHKMLGKSSVFRSGLRVGAPTPAISKPEMLGKRRTTAVRFEGPMNYYAAMTREERSRNQTRWKDGELNNSQSYFNCETFENDIQTERKLHIQVMIATCAFGTGINSKVVDSVIHAGFAWSLID